MKKILKILLKILYFLPAIFFICSLVVLLKWMVGSIDWSEAIPFTLPFVISGFLLSKNIFWGGFISLVPAIWLISFGKYTKTGLELPTGIILFLYYIICSFICYKVNHKKIRNTDLM